MKLLFDFFPIILFFIAFKVFNIYIATAVAIISSIIQVFYTWFKNRRVEVMHIITLTIIVVLGSATLLFHNELFIKWKPTAINWIFAIAFITSQFFGEKPLIRRMMENNIQLPNAIWTRLNLSWVIFFTTMGAANLYVIYNYDTNTWVNFKLFGILGLTVVFVIAQAVYLTKHVDTDQEPQNSV